MAEPEIATKAPESDATEKPKSTEPKTAEETLGMGVCLRTAFRDASIGTDKILGTLRDRSTYSYVPLNVTISQLKR